MGKEEVGGKKEIKCNRGRKDKYDCTTCENKCEGDRSLEGWAKIIMKKHHL
jgi:hypothetical protein